MSIIVNLVINMMNKLSYPRWLYKRAHAHVQIRMQLRSFLDTKNTQWYQRSSLPGLPGLPGLPQIFNFPNFLTLHFGSMCIYTILYIYIYEYSIFGQAISYCRTTDLYIYIHPNDSKFRMWTQPVIDSTFVVRPEPSLFGIPAVTLCSA